MLDSLWQQKGPVHDKGLTIEKLDDNPFARMCWAVSSPVTLPFEGKGHLGRLRFQVHLAGQAFLAVRALQELQESLSEAYTDLEDLVAQKFKGCFPKYALAAIDDKTVVIQDLEYPF